jgi:hypothetical protein
MFAGFSLKIEIFSDNENRIGLQFGRQQGNEVVDFLSQQWQMLV